MSDEEETREHVTHITAPSTLFENRVAIRFILVNTVKNAYNQMLEEKMITKKKLAENMGESTRVIDALLESIDLWSFEMLADFLWGLNLSISGIMLGTTNHSEEEENENERIH